MSNALSHTYAEIKGAEPTNWHLALRPNRNLTANQWDAMSLLSGSWVTCACGNLCAALNRSVSGYPEDDVLYHLGGVFHRAIKNRRKAWARDVLARIEARSTFLLTEMGLLAPQP